MIIILIAAAFAIIGTIVFHAVKEDAAYSSIKKFIAYCGALSPMIALLFVLIWTDFIELDEYKYIKEQAVIINQEVISAKLDNNVPNEVIEKVEKHNKLCERHYELFQSSIKWSVLGKFRKSALEYRIEIPDTTVIDTTEYKLVPKGE